MIDAITISGLIRAVKATDAGRFNQVAFLKENGTTFKRTTGYYSSPLTGAQFELTPEQVRHNGDIYWRLHFWLPVNALLRGQNYVLPDVDMTPHILRALAKFCRWFLLDFGFAPAEVDYFIKTARFENAEFSYHVLTASDRAATKAQTRLLKTLECLNQLRVGDYDLHDVDVFRSNGAMTVYAHLNGAMLRVYLKGQVHGRSNQRRARMVGFLSQDMHKHAAVLRDAVRPEIRVEVVAKGSLLEKFGISRPHGFNPDQIGPLIDEVFRRAGLLIPFVNRLEDADQSSLSPEVRETLQRYFAGEDLGNLSTSTRSRHGKALRAVGVEIAIPLPQHRNELSGTIGKQLQFKKRRKAPESLANLMLMPDYLQQLDAELQRQADAALARFNPVMHDMRELERQQGLFMNKNRDQYLDGWMRSKKGAAKP